ncbi:NAD+ kinase [Ruminococcaceae bacterium YAD3003]|nr:NAD+ kinase [Ruminococcaceae bacterium YAD3003]
MNYGICSNGSRDTGYETAIRVADIIASLGSVPVFEAGMDEVCPNLKNIPGVVFEDFSKTSIKTIISIGGDGTFLSKVAKYRNLDTEFVGVNLGSIGFLNEIGYDNLENDLKQLVSGDYNTIDRTQLKCDVFNKDGELKGSSVCLNDIIIVRGAKPHITTLVLAIDGQIIERFRGDGLVISTATGSSAYNLSAGGPILMPEMKDIIVTPICSHTLNGYTYVATPESEIKITLEEIETAPMICPDGRDFVDLQSYDSIVITRYDKVLKTVCLKKDGFFSNVRKKIVQRGYFYENR